MKRSLLLLASPLVAAVGGHAVAAGAAVTPVQKVIQMLQGMLEKGKSEKHAEQVTFAAFKQFCDDTSVTKQRAIKKGEETIEQLNAAIQKNIADAELLTREIAGLDEDVSVWTGDSKAAADVRKIEKADYDATHKDYSESVDALQRAIAVLKKQGYDRKQASLAQVAALKDVALIPVAAKRAIELFLQNSGAEADAPEANAYEFQSSGIVEMLDQLLDKFVEERTTLEKEETNAKHAYELLSQDLKAQIDQASRDRGEKAEFKAKALQGKADAEGDLSSTTATRDADKKYLGDLTATCSQKASDFESRQQMRAEEIQAIEKAIEIISGSAVQGSAEKHLPSLVQSQKKAVSAGRALAQLRSNSNTVAQRRVADYLRRQGESLHSRMLTSLASEVADDPFQKVKKMIQDLIVRLMEEANQEASHKGWCDTELASNEQTRKEKTDAVEELHAEVDELQASIAKLTADIADLSAAVAALDVATAKATQIRQDEKAKNTETIKDAEAAQTAVAQALTVLKEFYAKAAEATSLVQQKALQDPEAPAIFNSPYKGMGAENGGVIGMLEVIESDFARLSADTTAAEATAQREYDEFISDSAVDKAQKNKDIEYKSAKKQDESQALVTKQGDLEGTQKELDAALAYFDKLKPSCIDSGTSYEDRVARRKEEIQSLQEALRILNGEDVA